jgi:hypothetical protein
LEPWSPLRPTIGNFPWHANMHRCINDWHFSCMWSVFELTHTSRTTSTIEGDYAKFLSEAS